MRVFRSAALAAILLGTSCAGREIKNSYLDSWDHSEISPNYIDPVNGRNYFLEYRYSNKGVRETVLRSKSAYGPYGMRIVIFEDGRRPEIYIEYTRGAGEKKPDHTDVPEETINVIERASSHHVVGQVTEK